MIGKQELLAAPEQAAELYQANDFLRDLMTTNGGDVVAPHNWGGESAYSYVADEIAASQERTASYFPIASAVGELAINR
jgi:hypothetical protein